MTEREAELEARVAELREALEFIPKSGSMIGHAAETKRQAALSRPDDFSALNEAKAKVLEEAATICDKHAKEAHLLSGDYARGCEKEAMSCAIELRDCAQEIREGK